MEIPNSFVSRIFLRIAVRACNRKWHHGKGCIFCFKASAVDRHWPIPNAPINFFLPSRLFWGICIGEFFDKGNCRKIREEFIKRYNNGLDYMLISGHVPDYNTECPQYARGM